MRRKTAIKVKIRVRVLILTNNFAPLARPRVTLKLIKKYTN